VRDFFDVVVAKASLAQRFWMRRVLYFLGVWTFASTMLDVGQTLAQVS
jgi:hypothetical protein